MYKPSCSTPLVVILEPLRFQERNSQVHQQRDSAGGSDGIDHGLPPKSESHSPIKPTLNAARTAVSIKKKTSIANLLRLFNAGILSGGASKSRQNCAAGRIKKLSKSMAATERKRASRSRIKKVSKLACGTVFALPCDLRDLA
jgi:hypothetical protein